MKQNSFLLICILACSISSLNAKVKLPAIFSSNMVLQQQSEVPFRGEASPGKTVKIFTSWNNKTIEIKADVNGKWNATLPTPAYGGPYKIEISDGKKLVLDNVLIGDVWICSGQSNMEMPLAGWGKVNNYEQEIAAANYPQIRLMHVKRNNSTKELNDFEAQSNGWVSCSPQTIPEFSSVAYFFGRQLHTNLNIPIGLINTSWGGTIAEAWTSAGTLKNMPDFYKPVEAIENSAINNDDAQKKYEQDFATWLKLIENTDKGYLNGKPNWNNVELNTSDWKLINIPCTWEDKELPNFDGLVWMRKTIEIPAQWQNKNLSLNLDVIDDNDICYFNGVEIGKTEGWNLQRTYTVPAKLVKSGKAVVVVRIIDTGGGGGIYGDAAKINISLDAANKISLAGDWQYKIGFNIREIPAAPVHWSNPNRPTVLYNAMINPIAPFNIKGAIWYQGESNADRAYQYRELFPLMIKDWRKQWNSNFPFYFVQLANYMKTTDQPEESVWAELREAQLKTLHLENTGMAVTIDIGDAKDIHPKNKQDVGKRLAFIALAQTYKMDIPFSGPIYESYSIEGNSIRIKFKHAEKGLKTSDNQALKGFAIAGHNHTFQWAKARIEGNDVIVWCDNIEHPVAVRYAWANNPICNLCNEANLPASPFRTDDWQGVTYK